MTRVLFVGLGAMGAPMAANLARVPGVVVHGYDPYSDRTPDEVVPVDDLVESDVAVLCLPSIDQVEQVVRRLLAASSPPRVVVDTSTSDVARTRALAAEVQRAGVGYLDAPVARGRAAAAAGDLLVMVGGRAELVDEVRPLLESLGSDVEHCGPVGSGQVMKALNNMVLLMNVHALSEAVAVARACDVDPATLVRVLRRGSAGSFALAGQAGDALAEQDYPTGRFSVTYALKDAGVASRLSEKRLPGLQAVTHLLRRAEATGLGDAYYPSMAEVLGAGDHPGDQEQAGQRIELRTPAETTAAVTGQADLAPFTERRAGLAVYRALAHDPGLLNAWLPLCDHFLVAPAITPREREALILRTAYNCDSVYEWDKHAPRATEVGISADELAVLGGAPVTSALDPWLATLVALADELHLTSTVSDHTWDALGERWTDAQRTSCLMLVGQYHMLAFTLNGARITRDPADDMEGHS